MNLYPYLLSKDLERDIHPVVEYLEQVRDKAVGQVGCAFLQLSVEAAEWQGATMC